MQSSSCVSSSGFPSSRRLRQCVTVCCSVLQCVSVCCSALQFVTVCWIVLQCVAGMLQCVAVLFSATRGTQITLNNSVWHAFTSTSNQLSTPMKWHSTHNKFGTFPAGRHIHDTPHHELLGDGLSTSITPFSLICTTTLNYVLFWMSTRTAPGPISQVLPGCRVRHPQYSKKLFVRHPGHATICCQTPLVVWLSGGCVKLSLHTVLVEKLASVRDRLDCEVVLHRNAHRCHISSQRSLRCRTSSLEMSYFLAMLMLAET